MVISSRWFWLVVLAIVAVASIGGWALLMRPKQLPPHERGRKVTDPREIQMLEHPELEYLQKQPQPPAGTSK
ncbi:hypothetical protein HRbin17_02369 [bacterium HR17]|jgi:hypothetical protein|uniref:Uncharacterized protein n=1 Tax=Candidatus Fervidibacter japonicus TaxID=2035412 RepID=A0A2H5XF66_9BACT|nr:hypothetical protein HRbin17_02369 [bacterium HR17]